MDVELTVDQIQELKVALLRSFTRGEMEQVVRFGLPTTYDQIVRSGGTLDQEFLDVVEWANRNHMVMELVTAARQKNSGNPRLRNFEDSLRVVTPPINPPTAPPAVQPTPPAVQPTPQSPLPQAKPTILFIAADPMDAPNPITFDRELRDMKDALRGSEFGRRFNLEVTLAARVTDLHRTLRETKPTIVHFAGHGETDGIILEDEDTGLGRIVPVAALAQFFTFYPSVQCVVFNACYTEELAEAVAQNVPYVIGMRTKANDGGSVKFAVAFYDVIGGAETADPYQQAYAIASNLLHMQGLFDAVQPMMKFGHKPIVPHPPA